MGTYEIIERLCTLARMQADIIQKQAEAIAQAEIAETLAADLVKMRETAAAELSLIEREYSYRRRTDHARRFY